MYNPKYKLCLWYFPKTYQVSQAKKSGHFKGSLQFHRYWWISTLIKLNVRSGLKI